MLLQQEAHDGERGYLARPATRPGPLPDEFIASFGSWVWNYLRTTRGCIIDVRSTGWYMRVDRATNRRTVSRDWDAPKAQSVWSWQEAKDAE
jgi:hypothetical protein